MNTENEVNKDIIKDLSKLLKAEGDFVQQLTDVATKGAEFHARLEAIEKALETDPCSYSSKESDKFVNQAKDKYSSELEDNMKQQAKSEMQAK